MSKLLIAFALIAVIACGGGKQPPPGEPAPQPSSPTEPSVMSPEECTAQAGQVRGDIGDGKIACAEGERELGRVRQGIEGAICCAPPATKP